MAFTWFWNFSGIFRFPFVISSVVLRFAIANCSASARCLTPNKKPRRYVPWKHPTFTPVACSLRRHLFPLRQVISSPHPNRRLRPPSVVPVTRQSPFFGPLRLQRDRLLEIFRPAKVVRTCEARRDGHRATS